MIYNPAIPSLYGHKFNRIKAEEVLHVPEGTSDINTTDESAQIKVIGGQLKLYYGGEWVTIGGSSTLNVRDGVKYDTEGYLVWGGPIDVDVTITLNGGKSIFIENIPSATTGNILYYNSSTGKISSGAVPAAGVTYTATNGLTIPPTTSNIELGGTLSKLTTINQSSSFGLKLLSTTMSSSPLIVESAIFAGSGQNLHLKNTSATGGFGMRVEMAGSGGGAGITITYASTTGNNVGVTATVGTYRAIEGYVSGSAANAAIYGNVTSTTSGIAGYFVGGLVAVKGLITGTNSGTTRYAGSFETQSTTETNTIHTALELVHVSASVQPLAGFGTGMNFVYTYPGTNLNKTNARIQSKYETVNGINSGTTLEFLVNLNGTNALATAFSLLGNGQAQLNKYTGTTFDVGTPPAKTLGVDDTGKLVTYVPAAGGVSGNIYTQSGTITSNRVVNIDSKVLVFDWKGDTTNTLTFNQSGTDSTLQLNLVNGINEAHFVAYPNLFQLTANAGTDGSSIIMNGMGASLNASNGTSTSSVYVDKNGDIYFSGNNVDFSIGGTISLNAGFLYMAGVTGAGYVLTDVAGDGTLTLQPPTGGGGQVPIQFKDEGANIGSVGAITEINYTGAGVTASVAGTVLNVDVPAASGGSASIIQTGLLVEYRFDEGSGTVVNDYSGNGNHGVYVGAPTMVGGGGFIATTAKYVTSVSTAWATMQTVYVAFEVNNNSANSNSGCVVGNSLGATAIEILTQNYLRSPYIFSGSPRLATINSLPSSQVIITLLIDAAGVINGKCFIDGEEVVYTGTQYATWFNYRTGVPWIGKSGGTHFLNSAAIYHFATYSTYHTTAQIKQNVAVIKDILIKRGNPLPTSILGDTATNNVLVTMGDSITQGQGAATTGWPERLTLNETFTLYNLGVPGITATLLKNATPGVSTLYNAKLAPHKICTIMAGTNDIVAGTAAQVVTCMNDLRTMCMRMRSAGFKVIVITQCARITNSALSSYNAMIRATWKEFADEIGDSAADPLIGADGASTNLTYFNADQTHPTDAGYIVIAQYISSAINRLTNKFSSGRTNALYAQAGNVTVTNTVTETTVVGPSATFNSSGWNNIVQVGTWLNNTPNVTAMAQTGMLTVGMSVVGTGIAAGTTISAIPSTTTLTLSANATPAGTNTRLTFSKIGVKKNYWLPGRSIMIEQKGLMTTAGTPTLNRKLKWGSVILASTGAITTPSSITGLPYRMVIEVTCVTVGAATGTFWIQGELEVQASAGGAYNVYGMNNSAVVSIDTTADAILDITDTWGTAATGNIDVATNLVITERN